MVSHAQAHCIAFVTVATFDAKGWPVPLQTSGCFGCTYPSLAGVDWHEVELSTKQTQSHERQLSGAEITFATVAKWPMTVLAPEPKYTTDGYQAVQSNNADIDPRVGAERRSRGSGATAC